MEKYLHNNMRKCWKNNPILDEAIQFYMKTQGICNFPSICWIAKQNNILDNVFQQYLHMKMNEQNHSNDRKKWAYDSTHIGKSHVHVWRAPKYVRTSIYIPVVFFLFRMCTSSFSCNPKQEIWSYMYGA